MKREGREFLNILKAIVGSAGIVEDEAMQSRYLEDELRQFHGRALAVVRPANTGEVAAIVKACVASGIPMVPHGGNTGYCGGATPDASGRQLLISLERMNRIHAVDPLGFTLTADAGCLLASVQAAAAAAGLLFPLSLGSEGSCQLGGNLSTNAGGLAVLRYGNIRDLVLGLEVVLPSGEVWDGMRALRKDNAGYDLKHLFIGAEGTLGIITRVVLKLFPQPGGRATALVAVPDVAAAARLLARARLQTGDAVTSFEYIPRLALALVLEHIEGARLPLDQAYDHQVLVELSAADQGVETVLEQLLEQALQAGEIIDAAMASSGEQRDGLWRLRESVPEAQRRAGGSYKHDVSVPTAKVADFMLAAERAIAAIDPTVRICAYGHLGDGNLHFNLQPSPGGSLARLNSGQGPEISRALHDLVDSFGGSVCAEHGVGQLKPQLLASYTNPAGLSLMRGIKQLLDPAGLMNPGKVLVQD